MKVHIFQREPGRFVVWLDTNEGSEDGLCVAAGATIGDAIEHAKQEVRKAMLALDMLADHIPQP